MVTSIYRLDLCAHNVHCRASSYRPNQITDITPRMISLEARFRSSIYSWTTSSSPVSVATRALPRLMSLFVEETCGWGHSLSNRISASACASEILKGFSVFISPCLIFPTRPHTPASVHNAAYRDHSSRQLTHDLFAQQFSPIPTWSQPFEQPSTTMPSYIQTLILYGPARLRHLTVNWISRSGFGSASLYIWSPQSEGSR